MKRKRLFGLFLVLILILGLFPVSAHAEKEEDEPEQEELYVYTEEDSAALDDDVFARISAVTDTGKKRGGALTEQDYIDRIPEVIEAIESSDTYREGTLQQNGTILVWETTIGIPCFYDPYLESVENCPLEEEEVILPDDSGTTVETVFPADAAAETEGQGEVPGELLTEQIEAAAASTDYPSSVKVALIQPYWESEDNNYDENFSVYGGSWKSIWEGVCKDTGSPRTYRYTMDNASVTNIAKCIEDCGVVIVNSHGTTDYNDGQGDSTSRANCSYLALKTRSGINSEDTKARTGPFGTYFYAMYGSSYTAVSGACIANHMTKDAPHSFIYWGMCLGMATDGMTTSLLNRGVEAVFGFTKSVSFTGDYSFMNCLFHTYNDGANLRNGGTLGDAMAFAKSMLGDWDPAKKAATLAEAQQKNVAFPLVVSSKDRYPGHGNVDDLQTVKSTWTMYQPGGRTFLLASDIEDLKLSRTAVLPGMSVSVKAKVNGTTKVLPTDKLAVSWEISTDERKTWTTAQNSNSTYTPKNTEVGYWLRGSVTPKNQDEHFFTLKTAPVQITEKLDNNATPVPPEVERGNSKPYASVLLSPKTDQEYIILTSPDEPTEADWVNARSFSSEQVVDISTGDEMTHWGYMNYLWTRFRKTDTYNAGSVYKCTPFYYGSEEGTLQGTRLNITLARAYNPSENHGGYWAGDVLKIDVLPAPSSAAFDGFPGSTWVYPLFPDANYGLFFEDINLTSGLSDSTKYKTVYLQLRKPVIDGYISCGTTATKGCYEKIDVANYEGHYPVASVKVPTYSVQIGKVTRGLPFTFAPASSTYNVERLTVKRNTNAQENGPSGTEPLVTFRADGTMTIDTTPCEETPYSLLIMDPDSGQVGKMLVWVGDFDTVTLEKLSFEEDVSYCYAGKVKWLTVRAEPDNGIGRITWSSSDESVMTVSGPGQTVSGSASCSVRVSDSAKSGDYARITVKSGYVSASCIVIVLDPPVITSQPKNLTVKEGKRAKFTIGADGNGLTYQWYYRGPDSTVWIPSQAASGRTDEYSFTAKASHNGFRYYCRVNEGMVDSREVKLTVLPLIRITAQPVTKKMTVGSKATFKVTAAGTGLTYQWQYRSSGSGTWKNCTSPDSVTASHKITAKEAYDGYQYRCKISDKLETVYSDAATLKVKPKITEQPKDRTVTVGSKTTFTVQAAGAKSYQWQYWSESAGAWKASGAATAKTASLSVTAKQSNDGLKYRCKLTNKTTSVYTAVVTLKVKPKITTQPTDRTVTIGEKTTFTVAATGGKIWQWEYRTSETGAWTEAKSTSAKTANYIVTTAKKHDGYQYRCKVTNKTSYVYTKIVTLKVKPKITTQPANKTVTAGKQVTFKVAAEGAKSYQWYYKKPGSDTWTKVSANGTSATYTLTTAARHNGYQYRCMVTNNVSYVNSKTVTLTVR